jgi:ATP:corrinoid adenosyltransferase
MFTTGENVSISTVDPPATKRIAIQAGFWIRQLAESAEIKYYKKIKHPYDQGFIARKGLEY